MGMYTSLGRYTSQKARAKERPLPTSLLYFTALDVQTKDVTVKKYFQTASLEFMRQMVYKVWTKLLIDVFIDRYLSHVCNRARSVA